MSGALDLSFGALGTVQSSFTGWDTASSVALQKDGKILTAGSTGGLFVPSDFLVARYDEHGTLDPTFGNAGFTSTNFGGGDFDSNDLANAIAVQDDGKIVLAGRTSAQNIEDFALARYNVDGSSDLSFGNAGKVITNFYGAQSRSEARGVAIQKDGKVVAAGYVYAPKDIFGRFALARYDTNGQLDQSFGNAGLVSVEFLHGFTAEGYGVAIHPNGSIVVVGSAHFGNHIRFALAGVNPADGSLEKGFGIGGLVTTTFPGSASAFALAIDPNGLVAAAGSTVVGNIERIAVAMYEPNGAPYKKFGGTGKAVAWFGDFGHKANAVGVLRKGPILIAGQTLLGTTPYYQTVLAEFGPNGILSAYGPTGIAVVPIGLYSRANGLAIDAQQRAVTAGLVDTGGGGTIAFALTRHL